MATASWFERIGTADAQALASDVGPVPMNVGALLVLDPVDLDPARVRSLLERRLAEVPRMRQRLQRVPPGCGRPIWVDDAEFDPGRHVHQAACPAPGDRRALLDLAVAVVTAPLDRARPLWRASVITGLADGRTALVVAFHHVLADGIGGLAVLGALVDGAPVDLPRPLPAARPLPTPRALRAEARAQRARAVRRLPEGLATLGAGLRELGTQRPRAAARSSLTTPTGPRRRIHVVQVPLSPVRAAARAHGATINDLLLTAATGALESLLDARGEAVAELVVSVPVSARDRATTEQLGNSTGVMPVRVPMLHPASARLAAVARVTAEQRGTQRGASAALLTPAFRALAAMGLFRPMIDRQRLVNSFLTNMHGPDQLLHLTGAAIREVVPITSTAGNVTVAFAVLSYAGTLGITVIVDPDAVPESDQLAGTLAEQLHALAAAPMHLT